MSEQTAGLAEREGSLDAAWAEAEGLAKMAGYGWVGIDGEWFEGDRRPQAMAVGAPVNGPDPIVATGPTPAAALLALAAALRERGE